MAWLNFVILITAIIFVLFALVSLLQGVQARMRASSAPYDVGRQESRRRMLVAFLRMGVAGILALILFGVYGLSVRPEGVLSVEPETDMVVPATATVERDVEVVEPTATTGLLLTVTATVPAAPISTATATPEIATMTPEPTDIPTITPTSPPSAVVTSEVGLYLRERPGGIQELELLPAGTILILLGGQETVDDIEWREVRTPSGLEGWVAVDFIELQQ